MRRDHITATQMADFWRCRRKAWFTDRLTPTDRDPVGPLQELIFSAGNDFEDQVVAEIPGVADVDRKSLGMEAAAAETLRLMESGVPAIHHGILLGREDGVGFVAESDLLIRSPGSGPRYSLREIKNSAHPSSPQALQLALNIWLLRKTGFAADHHEIRFRGGSAPVLWDQVDSVFDRSRKDLVALLKAGEIPGFHLHAGCEGCDWKTHCHSQARKSGDLGFLHSLTEAEKSALTQKGISGLVDLSKAAGNPTEALDPKRFFELSTRARALVEGKRLPIPLALPRRKWNETTWLLHLGRDLPVTKGVILWAGVRLGGADGFAFTGPDAAKALLDFFSAHPREPFLTTTGGTLHQLRSEILPAHALGDPRTLHEAVSVEQMLWSHFAWPMPQPSLRDFIAWHRQDPDPMEDPLETLLFAPNRAADVTVDFLRETRRLLRETPWT